MAGRRWTWVPWANLALRKKVGGVSRVFTTLSTVCTVAPDRIVPCTRTRDGCVSAVSMSVCRLCVCLLANTSGISLPYALRAHRSARAHLAEGVADGVHVRRRAPALRDEALVRHVVVELATHTHARQLQVQGQVQLSSAHTRQARLQGSGAARALASTWTNELGSRVRPQPEGWGPEFRVYRV